MISASVRSRTGKVVRVSFLSSLVFLFSFMVIIDGISRSTQVGYIVIHARLVVVFMGTTSW